MANIILSLTVIALSVIATSCSSHKDRNEFRLDAALANIMCPKDRRTFVINAPSDISCLFKCKSEDDCFGISYQASSRKCVGCRPYRCSDPISDFETLPDSVFYKWKHDSLVFGVRPLPLNNIRRDANSNSFLVPCRQKCESQWVIAGLTTAGTWIEVKFWGLSEVSTIAQRNYYGAVNVYSSLCYFEYSLDCVTFTLVKDLDGHPVAFSVDSDSTRYQDLPYPVTALCVRLSSINESAFYFDMFG